MYSTERFEDEDEACSVEKFTGDAIELSDVRTRITIRLQAMCTRGLAFDLQVYVHLGWKQKA